MPIYHPGPVAIDDMTGFKVPHRALKRQWDGAYTVDPDKRNPQDLIRARPERSGIPHPRPETDDTFFAVNLFDDDGIPLIDENGDPVMGAGPLNGEGL